MEAGGAHGPEAVSRGDDPADRAGPAGFRCQLAGGGIESEQSAFASCEDLARVGADAR